MYYSHPKFIMNKKPETGRVFICKNSSKQGSQKFARQNKQTGNGKSAALCARFQIDFFFVKTQQYTVHNLSNIQEVKTRIFDFKSNSKRKMPVASSAKGTKGTTFSSRNRETKTEYEERTERLRQVLESRQAKSAANDKEKVQSAAPKDNINGISNDAKKAK